MCVCVCVFVCACMYAFTNQFAPAGCDVRLILKWRLTNLNSEISSSSIACHT